MFNPNCDGAHCGDTNGKVRLLPTGNGSNLILCENCHKSEIIWRDDRNLQLEPANYYDLPIWHELVEYKS